MLQSGWQQTAAMEAAGVGVRVDHLSHTVYLHVSEHATCVRCQMSVLVHVLVFARVLVLAVLVLQARGTSMHKHKVIVIVTSYKLLSFRIY